MKDIVCGDALTADDRYELRGRKWSNSTRRTQYRVTREWKQGGGCVGASRVRDNSKSLL